MTQTITITLDDAGNINVQANVASMPTAHMMLGTATDMIRDQCKAQSSPIVTVPPGAKLRILNGPAE